MYVSPILNIIKSLSQILIYLWALMFNIRILLNIVNKISNISLHSIRYYTALLQSDEDISRISNERGLSINFLKTLYILGKFIIKLETHWNEITSKKSLSNNNIKLNDVRVHIDQPIGFFKIVDQQFTVSGWSVDFQNCKSGDIRVRIGNIEQPIYAVTRPDLHKVFFPNRELANRLEFGFISWPSVSTGIHRLYVEVSDREGSWINVLSILIFRPFWTIYDVMQTPDYKTWVNTETHQLAAELPEIALHIDVMTERPKFIIIIDRRRGSLGLESVIDSLKSQIYKNFVVYYLDDVIHKFIDGHSNIINSLNEVFIEDKSEKFIIYLNCKQILSSNALYEFARTINQYPDTDLIYGDEDHLNENAERCEPFYKPDWSPDYLETFNYIGFTSCFRLAIIQNCMDATCFYDLVLRFTEITSNIVHVDKILGHNNQKKSQHEVFDVYKFENLLALNSRLKRTNRDGFVREHYLFTGCYEIKLNLKNEPLVSIIIPTAGKTVNFDGRDIDLIVNIVSQIRNLTSYKNIEIIIVDNGDLSEIQFSSLLDMKCKFITFDEKNFNISKKINIGSNIAEGVFLILLNDDIEILSPDWIERMLEHFEKPHVGVVGAKLLYPNGLTQHVGVVHNNGNPDHVRTQYPRNENGYYHSTCGVRNYMAVTGAVLMTRADLFRSVGGFTEELAISYNDTDYCLKVRAKGLSIVYAPLVELTHMESMSCVRKADPDEVRFYHERWASETGLDPFYNEKFMTVAPSTFVPHVNQRKL